MRGEGTTVPLDPLFVWYIKCRQSQLMEKDLKIIKAKFVYQKILLNFILS